MTKNNGYRLRIGRFSESNRIYLLTTSTASRAPIFSDFNSASIAANTMSQIEKAGHIQSLAYVIMPDHIHWLIQLNGSLGLSGVMRSFKGYSANKLNQLRNMAGSPVWQRGYYDRALRSEDDLLAVARYIVANPLRAKLVKRLGEYPFWNAVWL